MSQRMKQVDAQLELERVWERRLAQAEAAQVEEEEEFWRERLGRLGANLQKIEALRRELQVSRVAKWMPPSCSLFVADRLYIVYRQAF